MPTATPPLEILPDPDRAFLPSYLRRAQGPGRHAGHDELVGDDGQVRPHWRAFVSEVEQLGMGEVAARWQRAQEQIHENGVSFNVYGDPQGMERPWPLSPLPILVSQADYAAL